MRLARPQSRDYRSSVDEIGWAEFLEQFRWEQGEHVTLIGPTKAGKTTLAREILECRDYVVGIFTKPKDESLSAFREYGYRVVRSLPLPPYELHPRVAYWPPSEHLTRDLARQKDGITELLVNMYRQGGDALYVDELWHVAKRLNLEPLIELFWRMGRTQGISLVTSAQRPAFIPRVAYSQAGHLFFWHNADAVDVKNAAGLAGQDRNGTARAVASLPRYSFLYVNTFTHSRVISRVQLDGGRRGGAALVGR